MRGLLGWSLGLGMLLMGCRGTAPEPPVEPPPREPVGRWAPAGRMDVGRGDFCAALMPDGRVLVSGGMGEGGEPALRSTEWFDPVTDAWRPGPKLGLARREHGCVALRDGRVIVAGGMGPGGGFNGFHDSAEVFEPGLGRFRPLPPLPAPMHSVQAAVLLPDGRAAFAAPAHLGRPQVAVFDPKTDRWSTPPASRRMGTMPMVVGVDGVGVLFFGASEHRGSRFWWDGPPRLEDFGHASLLTGGEGPWRYGRDPLDDHRRPATAAGMGRDVLVVENARSVVFTTRSRRHEALPRPRLDRTRAATLTAIDDHRVLAAGGLGESGSAAELFDRAQGQWFDAAPLPQPRERHHALRLRDGRVLVIGGLAGLGPDHFNRFHREALVFSL